MYRPPGIVRVRDNDKSKYHGSIAKSSHSQFETAESQTHDVSKIDKNIWQAIPTAKLYQRQYIESKFEVRAQKRKLQKLEVESKLKSQEELEEEQRKEEEEEKKNAVIDPETLLRIKIDMIDPNELDFKTTD